MRTRIETNAVHASQKHTHLVPAAFLGAVFFAAAFFAGLAAFL